jgi:hypothetical protein
MLEAYYSQNVTGINHAGLSAAVEMKCFFIHKLELEEKE